MMAHTLSGEGVIPGPTLYEIYRLTETQDGHLIYFAASNDEFRGLFRAIDREDLSEDERFATAEARGVRENLEALGSILLAEFRKWKTDELLERMVAEDVPAGPVHDIEGVLSDPQIQHNGSIFEREYPSIGTIRQCKPAARFDKTQAELASLPPLHGEHTDEILSEVGFDEGARASLRDEGVVV
jgi:crotonobetainyl-CoA:carnitine CoA-transferase CaiB-like acyl-CoA transferase